MHTNWISFNDMLSARRVAVLDETRGINDANEFAIKSLENPECHLSYRFELIVPKRKNSLMVMVRALPANSSYLNDDERLSGHNVSSLLVHCFPVAFYGMPNFCKDLHPPYPCAPVMFSDRPIDMVTYKVLVISGFQPLMH